jgi:hypothetical protein
VLRRLDHLVILSSHLDRAVSGYEGLGFAVTPGGEHADGLTRNALIPFKDGSYLELVAFVDPERPRDNVWDRGSPHPALGAGSRGLGVPPSPAHDDGWRNSLRRSVLRVAPAGSIHKTSAVCTPIARRRRRPRLLQRQSKALTRIRSWSRCERSLLSTPETKSRFNRYDQRCRAFAVLLRSVVLPEGVEEPAVSHPDRRLTLRRQPGETRSASTATMVPALL